MANDTLIQSTTLTAIADAIREKTETTDVMYPSEMAGKIRDIKTGGIPEPITAGETVVAAVWSEASASRSAGEVKLLSMQMKKAGSYRFKTLANGTDDSDNGGTHYYYLYINGVKKATLSAAEYYNEWISFDVNCLSGDVVDLYAEASSNYATKASYWLACINWDNGVAYKKITSTKTMAEIFGTYGGNEYKASGIYVTVPISGNYTVTYTARKNTTFSSYSALLYKNGKALSDGEVTWSNKTGTYNKVVNLNADDRLEIYGKVPYNGNNYYVTVYTLKIEEA